MMAESCEDVGKKLDVSFAGFFNMTSYYFAFSNNCVPYKLLADPEVPQDLVFVRQPSSLTKVTGQSAVFPCVAAGFPAPYIRWTRNEEELITEG